MKKQLTTILAAVTFISLALSFPCTAQERMWNFGAETGVSVSKYGQDAELNDFKSGAIGGLFVTYYIKNSFGITTKVLYAQKGALLQSSDNKQTLNYIEMPVIGRFFLNQKGNLRPNIFVGPSFGIMRSAANKIGNDERVEVGSYKPYYNTFDFGVTGGMGFDFKVAHDLYFVVDGRYTHGLSDITKAAGVVNNNSFGLTAGLSFSY